MNLSQAMSIQNHCLLEEGKNVVILRRRTSDEFNVVDKVNLRWALKDWEIFYYDNPKCCTWEPDYLNNFVEVSIYGDWRVHGHC